MSEIVITAEDLQAVIGTRYDYYKNDVPDATRTSELASIAFQLGDLLQDKLSLTPEQRTAFIHTVLGYKKG